MSVRLLRCLTDTACGRLLVAAARERVLLLPKPPIPSQARFCREKRQKYAAPLPLPQSKRSVYCVFVLERIRIEIVSNFHADAALTLRKKRGFSVCSVAGSRSRDYQSDPHFQCGIGLERIRIEIVSNFHADAALTLRKKRGFSVCSVAGSRSRDYQSNPHFQCGIALMACRFAEKCAHSAWFRPGGAVSPPCDMPFFNDETRYPSRERCSCVCRVRALRVD